MSEQSTDDIEQSAYRLSENLILLGKTLNDAQYAANRYQKTGFEHKREDALQHLRELRDFADEIIERSVNTETDQ